MSMTDPLADMLTRIRNGQHAGLFNVNVPKSNSANNVLKVLQEEGYIAGYKEVDNGGTHKEIKVELKYVDGSPVIKTIKRASKPGRRLYSKIKELGAYYNGLGTIILSTSKGVMSDHEARKQNIGGEVLCYVF